MNTTTHPAGGHAPAWMRLALLAGLMGCAAPTMAQITLYEAERFEGRSVSSQRRLPDLGRSGFQDGVSSVIVLDERWEVCEDARFRDRCKVLKRGRYPSVGAMGLTERVASARPVAANEQVDPQRYAPEAVGFYDARRRRDERLYQAPVSAVRAVMGPPEQRCWMEREAMGPQRDGNNNVPAALAGAVIGGILGHQIGGGTGRDIATVGGVVAGAAVGSRVGNDRPGDGRTRDVQRCANVSETGPVDHYEVSYSFRGLAHQIQTTTPPGATVTVNRRGEPRQ
ncbi:beta/gamma crystallin-related protein [Hydrogenophaga sp. OTU3427]|uniref:beta/gamma crystallin-related protein n=1 Tax=Hydrogenophaga sp. OTU3427 TaxID=3043856 RepID=UPI00313C5E00